MLNKGSSDGVRLKSQHKEYNVMQLEVFNV